MPRALPNFLMRFNQYVPVRRVRNQVFRRIIIPLWPRVTDDLVLPLPGTDMSVLADYGELLGFVLCSLGDYEREVHEFISANLKPGDTFIDIGAHFGFHSMYAARAIGPAGRLFAFEPGEYQRRYLNENIRRNNLKQVDVVVSLLGDRPGPARYARGPAGQAGMSSIALGATEGVEMPMTTLDQFCTERKITSIGGIKMDVEGAEHLVMLGARRVLKEVRPRFVLYECVDRNSAKYGHTAKETHDLLRAAGYRIHALIGGRIEPYHDEPILTDDFVAIRQ